MEICISIDEAILIIQEWLVRQGYSCDNTGPTASWVTFENDGQFKDSEMFTALVTMPEL